MGHNFQKQCWLALSQPITHFNNHPGQPLVAMVERSSIDLDEHLIATFLQAWLGGSNRDFSVKRLSPATFQFLVAHPGITTAILAEQEISSPAVAVSFKPLTTSSMLLAAAPLDSQPTQVSNRPTAPVVHQTYKQPTKQLQPPTKESLPPPHDVHNDRLAFAYQFMYVYLRINEEMGIDFQNRVWRSLRMPINAPRKPRAPFPRLVIYFHKAPPTIDSLLISLLLQFCFGGQASLLDIVQNSKHSHHFTISLDVVAKLILTIPILHPYIHATFTETPLYFLLFAAQHWHHHVTPRRPCRRPTMLIAIAMLNLLPQRVWLLL